MRPFARMSLIFGGLVFSDSADPSIKACGRGPLRCERAGCDGSGGRGRWSEVAAGGRDFSTGFSADRDYRSESGSSETRFDSSLVETDVLMAGSDRTVPTRKCGSSAIARSSSRTESAPSDPSLLRRLAHLGISLLLDLYPPGSPAGSPRGASSLAFDACAWG
jgi:hypothetical protein